VTQRRPPRIETNPVDVNGAAFAAARVGLHGREDAGRTMNDVIDNMVDRIITQAQRMLDEGLYDWPISRTALTRILADLEARTLGHPSLERLRRYIAQRDEAWNAGHGKTK
jgi:hypothetical protein